MLKNYVKNKQHQRHSSLCNSNSMQVVKSVVVALSISNSSIGNNSNCCIV